MNFSQITCQVCVYVCDRHVSNPRSNSKPKMMQGLYITPNKTYQPGELQLRFSSELPHQKDLHIAMPTKQNDPPTHLADNVCYMSTGH